MVNVKDFFLLLIFLFIFNTCSFASENRKPQVLFINQVRGEECCGKGSFDNLKLQINAFKNYQIPVFFALRYDVLTNDTYVDYLKNEIKEASQTVNLGLFIEITPRLAKDAQVIYYGHENQWFEAQNVFTIGYQIKDRKKLLDQLFTTFHNKFDFYPILTSSWLIDTDSLNYLQKKYGVIAHQITREQWGTDSYTLSGGPVHYPYPGSRSWAFIPDFDNKDPVLMLRQTVSDPLYNYGDTTNSFTSQPNDYLKNKDFSYFKLLINQALFQQKTIGFALLGLENSNEEKYQDEFLKQIAYVYQLKNEDKIVFPGLRELKNFWIKQKTTSYQGKGVEWSVTPTYRVRIKKQGGKLYLTDFRYYDKNLIDPYNDYVAKKNGYWIVPYLINSSLSYSKSTVFPKVSNDLLRKTGQLITTGFDFSQYKINSANFNRTRLKNYPYFLPEPTEREISRQKTQLKITVNKKITLDLKVKDQYGYPDVISAPVEIKTDPPVEGIEHKIDGESHVFSFSNPKTYFLNIIIVSNQKTIKNIFLFPKFLPFLKIAL
ncbi:hypothetical protein COW98_00835 [Candidatus Roizmanbacteria bacterium CG22_combo_CG10-13_8_21_14_all_35_9]|uniref:Uncharacterized protein n=3 Tax=Candidatus Roizmaniibacteriota TaxID=1752723 RepID=A0A2M8F4B1_9BACT|nr:MAG: hypothetical protein COW98_00835 [Candidatus Roizmanbacteria bacterium CG22_combo_CG10-13_8_21_14_all_35_9]PJC34136.1 MAG: hypothetical protein CO048_01070 [Candidatus Roizmanbacteria bacterium CG_4_9_14_0_2_um_filter_35_15]